MKTGEKAVGWRFGWVQMVMVRSIMMMVMVLVMVMMNIQVTMFFENIFVT